MKLYNLIIFLFIAVNGFANNTPSTIFNQLSHRDVLEVAMELDLEALTSDIRNEDKHPSTFSFVDANGGQQNWDIQVKLRGKFRRMRCTQTPPLKLYFDKDDLAKAGLADFNDMKLVNHCMDDDGQAKDHLIKEFLVYKMYNQLTPESFRVQLLKITFKDTKTNSKLKQWAFVIEDTAELKARIDAKKYKSNKIPNKENYDLNQLQTMSLFQYMIGNTDWKKEYEKNTKLVKKADKILVLPYDFDFSGIVNPPYAIPNSSLGQISILERIYLGFPEDIETLAPIIHLFQQHKTQIYDIVKSCKPLKNSSSREMIDYLDSFYNDLNPSTISNAVKRQKNFQIDLSQPINISPLGK